MKRVILLVGVVLVAGALWYGISPLFRGVEINEAPPQMSPEVVMNDVMPGGTSTPPSPIPSSQPSTSKGPYPIIDTLAHPAKGFVRIIEANGKAFVRYEDFKTINGPDIFVYLSKDLDAKEFVELGRVKATEGNINYEVPEGVDVDEYSYVLVWCKAFGVLFNSAKID